MALKTGYRFLFVLFFRYLKFIVAICSTKIRKLNVFHPVLIKENIRSEWISGYCIPTKMAKKNHSNDRLNCITIGAPLHHSSCEQKIDAEPWYFIFAIGKMRVIIYSEIIALLGKIQTMQSIHIQNKTMLNWIIEMDLLWRVKKKLFHAIVSTNGL